MDPAVAVSFITLGCPKNEVDTDRMAARVQASAYALADDLAGADVVVVNTCSFIQAATEESIAAVLELASEWRPHGDHRHIIVTGCMPSRYGADLAGALTEADAFVPVVDESTILDVLESITGHPACAAVSRGRTLPGSTAYLKVSEGCDRRCAYCTIPDIRGAFVSDPPEALLAEARFLISGGAKEIVLVGQDIASYGHDLGTTDIAALVRSLDALDGDFRIRLMYVQPDGVTDDLLAAIAASAKVCRYLDVPLQHASRRILASMGRSGDADSHLDLLDRIRSALPGVVLRTTLIAGYPGETEDEARLLESFIEEAAFDYAGVFAYSPEEGTLAAALPNQTRPAVRAARAQRLRDVADAIGIERASMHVGGIERVLVEGIDEDGEMQGRTCGQAPEIDGVTIVEGCADPGTFCDVRIVDAVGYDLIGIPR
jgi:ribosomal protein S12 methylthiotransferase